jgi:hypothetical protein
LLGIIPLRPIVEAVLEPVLKSLAGRRGTALDGAALGFLIGVKALQVHLRQMKNNWASVSGVGRLTLNAELVGLPKELGEFVIVHELVHQLAPNHDKVFESNPLEPSKPNHDRASGRMELVDNVKILAQFLAHRRKNFVNSRIELFAFAPFPFTPISGVVPIKTLVIPPDDFIQSNDRPLIQR